MSRHSTVAKRFELPLFQRVRSRIHAFFLTPASPVPLACLRIALASVLLFQAYLLSSGLLELYGPQGLVQGDLRRFMLAPALPIYVDWTMIAAWLHTSADLLIRGLFLVYVAALGFLLLGLYSRQACFVAWLGNLLIKLNLGYSSSYGVDTFTHIFLFYLMWMPMNETLSLDSIMGRTQQIHGEWQRLSLRVLQAHLCLIYFSTGVEKILGWQWRTGEVMWRAWMLPQFARFDFSWVAWHPWVATSVAWGTLMLEIGYPFFMSVPRTRKIGGYGIVCMHLGIAVLMGLWSFSLFMLSLTFCVFLIPADRPWPLWNQIRREPRISASPG